MSNENVSVTTESSAAQVSEPLQNTETPKIETQPDIGQETSQENNVKTNGHREEEGEKMPRSETDDEIHVPENDENVCENQKLLGIAPNNDSDNQTVPATQSNGTRYSITSVASGTRRLSFQPHCEKIKSNFLLSAFGSVTTIKSVGKNQTVNCRTVLWFLAFFGFMINYIYRVNINIAIVEMVNYHKTSTIDNNHSSECIVVSKSINNTAFDDHSSNTSLMQLALEPDVKSVHFDWDAVQQGHILGSFFWFHWTLQVVGGIIAPRFGTKLIFGLSNFIPCFLCAFIPMAARYDVNLLILLRVLQGFICALSWPSMHHLCAQWIPPNERSKFVTAYLGGSVCIALCYPFFGWVMSHWSWEPVFYLSAVLGTIWYAAWLYYVYDSPALHPRIDPMELIYIQNSLGDTLHKEDEKARIPWSAILRSKPVWINIFSQLGGVWCLFTLMAQAPTYFRQILGWNVQMTGLLSGIPHLFKMIFAFGYSMFSDSLLRNKRMSLTNVRKMACVVCNLLNGVFVVFLAFSGCNSMAAVVLITIATSVHGAISSGPLASFIDISPNYSSILLGLNGLVCVTPGFISPWIVGILTKEKQTVQQWQYIFLLSAGMLFVTGIVYVLFSDSSLQSWNQAASEDEIENGEKKCEKPSAEHSVNADPLKN